MLSLDQFALPLNMPLQRAFNSLSVEIMHFYIYKVLSYIGLDPAIFSNTHN